MEVRHMETVLAQIQALAPPPNNPAFAGTPDQWNEVEQWIGTVLPQDYKELINLYGCGSFGGRVCLLSPFIKISSRWSHFSLFRGIQALSAIEPFQRESPDTCQPFPVYPALGGLLPWGVFCSDAAMQCWRTQGKPDAWPTIVLDSDWSEEYFEYATSATGFLVGWLTGKIVISFFPEFPLPQPLFQPLSLGEG